MLRMWMLAVGLIVAVPVLAALLIDQGELITIETVDGEGHSHETQLWVVEVDGTLFVRSGNPNTRWAARMQAHPEIELRRGESHVPARAEVIPDSRLRDRVAYAMNDKYGAADDLWALMQDRDRSLVFALREISAAAAVPAAEAHP